MRIGGDDMSYDYSRHISDEELLLAADGELPEQQIASVQQHLAACRDCRARMSRFESTIANLVEARHRLLDTQITGASGPRAMLKAGMTYHLPSPVSAPRSPVLLFLSAYHRSLVAAACFLLALGLGARQYRSRHEQVSEAAFAHLRPGPVPDGRLTPGATRPVAISEICGMPSGEDVNTIPPSTQQKVFQEYGLRYVHAQDYEVDFLITPELGGSNDIKNLWPEPYASTAWNAHVKDQLENYLHAQVCEGHLDLSTAQRDIAADWVSAYKRYLHTNTPLSSSAVLTSN